MTLRDFKFEYEYEIDFENDFLILVCRLCIIKCHTHLIHELLSLNQHEEQGLWKNYWFDI